MLMKTQYTRDWKTIYYTTELIQNDSDVISNCLFTHLIRSTANWKQQLTALSSTLSSKICCLKSIKFYQTNLTFRKDLEMSGRLELMQYTVKDWIMEESSTGVVVTLVLGRKILNELLTTYLPTSLLIIIVHSTNYYKDFFFEAVVTVNLTGFNLHYSILSCKLRG